MCNLYVFLFDLIKTKIILLNLSYIYNFYCGIACLAAVPYPVLFPVAPYNNINK